MKLIDESPDASGEAGSDDGHLNPGLIVHLSSLRVQVSNVSVNFHVVKPFSVWVD